MVWHLGARQNAGPDRAKASRRDPSRAAEPGGDRAVQARWLDPDGVDSRGVRGLYPEGSETLGRHRQGRGHPAELKSSRLAYLRIGHARVDRRQEVKKAWP